MHDSERADRGIVKCRDMHSTTAGWTRKAIFEHGERAVQGTSGGKKGGKKVDESKRTDRIIEKCRDMHFTKATHDFCFLST